MALVELFVLEKALQEIHRELEDRPNRAGDPVRGLVELLERKAERA